MAPARRIAALLVAGTTPFLAAAALEAPHHRYVRQADPTSTGRHRGSTKGSATAAGSIQTGTFLPIAASMPTEATVPLPATYTAGSSPSLSGAGPLPSSGLIVANYPALDKIPPVDSAQMKKWLASIDLSNVPDIPLTQLGGCANASNAKAVANAGPNGACWWTCGGCTTPDDVTVCPQKGTWGVSYDDGPSPDTPRLLQFLDRSKLKSTFFVVGSRVLSRPEMLQYEYMDGNQISVHSWSHPALTTLSNEEIVAELMWTMQVIKDAIGVTPNTFRPPYGDVDNRVRAVAKACGLTNIIWTSTSTGETYDTEDWQIAAGTVSPAKVLDNFNTILDGFNKLDTGFIVLQHDLYQQAVDLAIEFVVPKALKDPGLTLEPIITCLGKDLAEAYIETAKGVSASSNSSSGGGKGSGSSGANGNSTSTTGTGKTNGTSGATSMSSDVLWTGLFGITTGLTLLL